MDEITGRYWDKPWSLVDGCTPCSPGCDHCWSAAMTHRFENHSVSDRHPQLGPFILTCCNGAGRFTGKIITHPDRLSVPLKRRKPTVYAVWNDLFHEDVPFDFQKAVYKTMIESRRHTFLVLSKRPNGMLSFHKELKYFNIKITPNPLPIADNIWHGLTVCNQAEDEKIPIFLQVPGKKFLSIEPLLGPVDLREVGGVNYTRRDGSRRPLLRYDALRGCEQCGNATFEKYGQIDAVILGGETGPGARPMHPGWVRSVRDQCVAASVPFFFKGWGEYLHENQVPAGQADEYIKAPPLGKKFGDHLFKVGHTNAGRLLDGRTHDDLPWRKDG